MATVEECRRAGMTLGRAMANQAATVYAIERDQARSALATVRSTLVQIVQAIPGQVEEERG